MMEGQLEIVASWHFLYERNWTKRKYNLTPFHEPTRDRANGDGWDLDKRVYTFAPREIIEEGVQKCFGFVREMIECVTVYY